MSRMAEQQMQEDDRRNDSGMDDYEAWIDSMATNEQKLIEEQDKRIADLQHTDSPSV